ncbi:MAG: hypothetical protein JWP24_1279, partial [Marmoricola sp.]|nr:hypothetical protein [Marmoricola sp.]
MPSSNSSWPASKSPRTEGVPASVEELVD